MITNAVILTKDHVYSPEKSGLLSYVVSCVRAGIFDTVVVEGRPGVGKTHFAAVLHREIVQVGIPVVRASTDDDVLPRSERKGKELPDFHQGEVCREVLSAREKGGVVDFLRYNTQTGKQDIPTHLIVTPREASVLLIEGVRSIETVQQHVAFLCSEVQGRVLDIFLEEDADEANARRAKRDIEEKGLPPDVVMRRINEQQGSVNAFYGDVRKSLHVGRQACHNLLIVA